MTGDANDHISTLYNLTIEKDADRTFNSIRKRFFSSVLLLNQYFKFKIINRKSHFIYLYLVFLRKIITGTFIPRFHSGLFRIFYSKIFLKWFSKPPTFMYASK